MCFPFRLLFYWDTNQSEIISINFFLLKWPRKKNSQWSKFKHTCYYLWEFESLITKLTEQLNSENYGISICKITRYFSLVFQILNILITPVGINIKGFVSSDFGMFLLLDCCIENERGSVGTPLCRVLINILSKSSKIVYFSQNCYFHVM